MTKNVETGDAAEFANVAKEVLYALNLAGQGLGIPDAEIAPLLRAAVNASSSLSRAVDLAEAAAGGSEPAEPTEATEMIAGQLDSVAVQVADFCDDLGLSGPAVAAGLESWSRPHPGLRGRPVSGGIAGVDVTANQGLMAPAWDNGVVRLYHADARCIPLPDESVHCVVTSPPYWNLRDYGLAPSVWGGDSGCPHYWSESVVAPGSRSSDDKSGAKQPNVNRRDRMPTSAFCGECGAWLGALGLEPTVDLYVAHIVEIFREVWRVLRKDGTCWINLGDSYTGRRDGNLKPKDLVGMPWRIAFALQDDGWWLRSPGIWEKPNPMPESVTDRLTTSPRVCFHAHEIGRPSLLGSPRPSGRAVQAVARLSLRT